MPIPPNIDFDKILTSILTDYADAARGWKGGRPQDEVAFLNRITEKLSRTRRKCDVGMKSPVAFYTKVHFLHREGKSQTDAFGADLAITIIFDENTYVKTAIFQLKKAKKYSITLDGDDLKASKEIKEIKERSFLFAIDENRLGSRIAPVDEIAKNLTSSKNKTITLDISGWDNLSHWIWKWFSCEVGPVSDGKDSISVESLLEKFVMPSSEEDSDEGFPKWQVDTKQSTVETVPAKVWLKAYFKPISDEE